MSRSKKSLANQLKSYPSDNCALLDGWKCPVCKKDFKDQYACPHGWDNVEKANIQRRQWLQDAVAEERTRMVIQQELAKRGL